MVPEYSVQYSQKPSTWSCPETGGSISAPPILSIGDPFQYYTRINSQLFFFTGHILSDFLTKSLKGISLSSTMRCHQNFPPTRKWKTTADRWFATAYSLLPSIVGQTVFQTKLTTPPAVMTAVQFHMHSKMNSNVQIQNLDPNFDITSELLRTLQMLLIVETFEIGFVV